MSQYQEPPVYRAAYSLCLTVTRFVKDCHSDYKLTIGALIQKEALDMLISVYKINEAKNLNIKVKKISRSLSRCCAIRTMNRLLLDLGIIKLETSVELDTKIEETAKQLAGWKKASEKAIII